MSGCVSLRRLRDPALLSECSDFPPSIPFHSLSFARAVPPTAMHRDAAGSCCYRSLVGTAPVPQSSAFDSHSWSRAGSPRFPGNPFANMPCSSTWRTGCAKAVTFRGLIAQLVRSLSALRRSDDSDRIPPQDSLPTGSQPYWDRTHLLGCFRRFPLCASPHRFPRGFPGAPTCITPQRLGSAEAARPLDRSGAASASAKLGRPAIRSLVVAAPSTLDQMPYPMLDPLSCSSRFLHRLALARSGPAGELRQGATVHAQR